MCPVHFTFSFTSFMSKSFYANVFATRSGGEPRDRVLNIFSSGPCSTKQVQKNFNCFKMILMIFSQTPLVSLKGDKYLGNVLVRRFIPVK